LQTRIASPSVSNETGIVLQYEARPKQGGRYLERVTLTKEQNTWRIAGYAYQGISTGR